MNISEKIKSIIKDLQDRGVPVPVFRDPLLKTPSITFSFFLAAGLVCLASTIDSIKAFSGINFNESKEFFDMCSWVYLGRSAIKGIIFNNGNNAENKQGEKND